MDPGFFLPAFVNQELNVSSVEMYSFGEKELVQIVGIKWYFVICKYSNNTNTQKINFVSFF